jgi:hypothetical protein
MLFIQSAPNDEKSIVSGCIRVQDICRSRFIQEVQPTD